MRLVTRLLMRLVMQSRDRKGASYPRKYSNAIATIALLLAAGSLSAQPKRIASTAPSITEMLFALGLGDRVVGVSTYCHYPPEVRKITKVATYLKPDMERLLSVRPDLVIIPKTQLHTRAPTTPSSCMCSK
jgi:ABC-type Fe3+-hydroxamate transport system, periplasmic component